jgi:hypothetical protein
VWAPHHSGIVDQNVHLLLFFDDLPRKLLDGLEGGQVQVTGVDAVVERLSTNVLCCRLTLLRVTTGPDDVPSSLSQFKAVCFPMPMLAPVTMTVFPGTVALLGQTLPVT